MTAPLDAVMPRSWVLAPVTTDWGHDITIIVGVKVGLSQEIPLPLGANLVRITWDGSTSLTVKRRVGGVDEPVRTIPAGSGLRSLTLDLPSRKAGEVLRFAVPRPTEEDVAKAQCSVTIFHTPPTT